MDEMITIADVAYRRAATATTAPSSSAHVLPYSVPLLSAFLAFAIAQFLKVITTWYKEKKWDPKKIVGSGGMPSSHSSTVVALAISIGLHEGVDSSTFAIAVVLAFIVMYDATGVRLHAGRQAENADPENFTIYIHSKPGFVFNEATTRSAFFYNRQLEHSVEVGWGKPTMIEAEKLLFKAALDDTTNQIFVLLSDSCVPLYNFSYIYTYLMSAPRSFVDSFIDANDTNEKRYNPEMSPDIPEDIWRKGSQWITLVRKHAEEVAYDHVVFPIFNKHCKRRPLLDLSRGNDSLKEQQQHNCIPDEHYVPTLLAMRGFEDELEQRTLTYSLWNQSTETMNTQAWHPVTFVYASASQKSIQEIKDIDHIYFKSENRTEWCGNKPSTLGSGRCYLFARKFSRGAAMRLLTNGVVGPYDPNTLVLDPT